MATIEQINKAKADAYALDLLLQGETLANRTHEFLKGILHEAQDLAAKSVDPILTDHTPLISDLQAIMGVIATAHQTCLVGYHDAYTGTPYPNPILSILGDNPVTLTVGDTYTDAGATAKDAITGTALDMDVEEDTVNTSEDGEYQVVYSATDSGGRTSIAVRNVTVVSAE